MSLELDRELEGIIHVAGLLEAACAFETIRIVRVWRTGNPANTVVCVIRDTGATLGGGEGLKTVIVDEYGGGPALASVSLHGLLDRLDGRCQDGFQTFLVNGHLDGNVRESAVDGRVWTGTNGGIVFRVGVIMRHGTNHHTEVLYDREGEEEGYTPEGRDGGSNGEADVIAVK